jgi:LPS sulfotransferase NodH
VTGVLFIVGASRSGSTLLERLLNELPGVMSVGELQRVWRRGFVENQLCSCGQPFQDCPFWGEVRQRLQADGSLADVGTVDALSRRAFRRGLRPLPTGEAILAHWSRLFGAIADVSGARWLVDSSKDPVYAARLARLPGFQTRYLHLIRDPRAVAYSKMRRRLRPEIHWAEAYMATRSAWGSAGSWNRTHRLAEAAHRAVGRPWQRLRYEDLAADPRGALSPLVSALDLPATGVDPLAFLGDGVARVGVGHSVSGNPMRFDHGELRVAPDQEWRHALPWRSRFEVGLRSYAGLRRYGYIGGQRD